MNIFTEQAHYMGVLLTLSRKLHGVEIECAEGQGGRCLWFILLQSFVALAVNNPFMTIPATIIPMPA